jgi:hypothetical protein
MALEPTALAKPLTDYFAFLSEFIQSPQRALAEYKDKGTVETPLVLNVAIAVVFG